MVAKSRGKHTTDLLHTFLNSLQHGARSTLRGCYAIGNVDPVEPAVHDLFPLPLQLCELFLLRGELCAELHAFGFFLSNESKQVRMSCNVVR